MPNNLCFRQIFVSLRNNKCFRVLLIPANFPVHDHVCDFRLPLVLGFINRFCYFLCAYATPQRNAKFKENWSTVKFIGYKMHSEARFAYFARVKRGLYRFMDAMRSEER